MRAMNRFIIVIGEGNSPHTLALRWLNCCNYSSGRLSVRLTGTRVSEKPVGACRLHIQSRRINLEGKDGA